MMKKRFDLENLDCANCAAKMEEAIRRIGGVEAVSVSFLTQKLTVTAPEDRFDAVMQEVAAVCRRVEPECVLHLK